MCSFLLVTVIVGPLVVICKRDMRAKTASYHNSSDHTVNRLAFEEADLAITARAIQETQWEVPIISTQNDNLDLRNPFITSSGLAIPS
jgi:hypothetical protein